MNVATAALWTSQSHRPDLVNSNNDVVHFDETNEVGDCKVAIPPS